MPQLDCFPSLPKKAPPEAQLRNAFGRKPALGSAATDGGYGITEAKGGKPVMADGS